MITLSHLKLSELDLFQFPLNLNHSRNNDVASSNKQLFGIFYDLTFMIVFGRKTEPWKELYGLF